MSFKRAVLLVLAVLLMPGLALAQTQTRATFNVTKDFADNNPNLASVTISCNTGQIIEQTQETGENGPALEFVVVSFDSGELDCSVAEEGLAGYTGSYDTTGSESTIDLGGEGCAYANVLDGANNVCVITNTPDPVEVVINKVWVINDGDELNGVSGRYEIELNCDGDVEITSSTPQGNVNNNYGNVSWNVYGDAPEDATFTAMVRPLDFDNNTCTVNEDIDDSAVEVDNTCEGDFAIGPDSGPHTCTVTNTVFFEGIPTLNQYGLAILALVMLGVGFVGFRRFA